MKSFFYSWMIFQLLIGIWLFISPMAFGMKGTHMALSNMVFGAIVFILGIATMFYEMYHKERFESGMAGMEHAKERS